MQKIYLESSARRVEPPQYGSFSPVRSVTLDELDILLADSIHAEAFDLIYYNDKVEIYRYFNRTGRDSYSVYFIAERLKAYEWCMTSGIGYMPPQRVYMWEKDGKRKLIAYLKENWNITF